MRCDGDGGEAGGSGRCAGGTAEHEEKYEVGSTKFYFMKKLDIERIKRGTPVVLRGSFGKVCSDGKVMIYANGHEVFMPMRAAETRLEKMAFFERRFRAGDEVNVTSRYGRFPVVSPMNHPWLGERVTVVEDEDDSGFVQVRSNSGHKMSVAFFFLELVSPVEERRPYEVVETMSLGGWQIMRDGLPLVLYDGNLHPNAKEAAEAECKRLNDEWQTKVCRSEEGKEEA